MYKLCKVVMLPTNEKSNIWWSGQKLLFNNTPEDPSRGECQYLYVLSDDEIKEGDWFINRQYFIEVNDEPEYDIWQCDDKTILDVDCKKVIASTDPSLIIKGEYPYNANIDLNLPSLPQSFVEEYVSKYNKGNKIEDIMVKYEEMVNVSLKNDEELIKHGDSFLELKLNPDNTINIKRVKDSWTRSEVIGLIKEYRNSLIPVGDDEINFTNKWIEENL